MVPDLWSIKSHYHRFISPCTLQWTNIAMETPWFRTEWAMASMALRKTKGWPAPVSRLGLAVCAKRSPWLLSGCCQGSSCVSCMSCFRIQLCKICWDNYTAGYTFENAKLKIKFPMQWNSEYHPLCFRCTSMIIGVHRSENICKKTLWMLIDQQFIDFTCALFIQCSTSAGALRSCRCNWMLSKVQLADWIFLAVVSGQTLELMIMIYNLKLMLPHCIHCWQSVYNVEHALLAVSELGSYSSSHDGIVHWWFWCLAHLDLMNDIHCCRRRKSPCKYLGVYQTSTYPSYTNKFSIVLEIEIRQVVSPFSSITIRPSGYGSKSST